MELSEAIRKGSKLRPQSFGAHYGKTPDGSLGTCVLGAAHEGAGCITITTTADGMVQIEAHPEVPAFPLLDEYTDGPLPCGCDDVGTQIGAILVHLNDEHHWPRERIASWARHIERK